LTVYRLAAMLPPTPTPGVSVCVRVSCGGAPCAAGRAPASRSWCSCWRWR
jgi:hypothetical protein